MPIVAKLDELGRPAWIVLMILGFIVWWPIGLTVLGYMIWSGRMGCWKGRNAVRWQEGADRMREAARWWQTPPSSGNRAFDDYRMDTLRRLEEEQREFRDFLNRLREAKDRSEFDQFMADRRGRANAAPQGEPQPQPGH